MNKKQNEDNSRTASGRKRTARGAQQQAKRMAKRKALDLEFKRSLKAFKGVTAARDPLSFT